MKVLVTPEFQAKVSNLLQDTPQLTKSLAALLRELERVSPGDFPADVRGYGVRAVDDDILEIELPGSRVLTSFGETSGPEATSYLLLVDILALPSRFPGAAAFGTDWTPGSNPLRNPSINPFRNPSINPLSNPSLNPLRNAGINPLRNPSINPLRNPSINPLRNPSINPLRNPSINPLRNPGINPLRNPSINPLRNRAFSPFLYDNSQQREGFVLYANEHVLLVFSMTLKFIAFGVKANDDVLPYFDSSCSWKGQFVRAKPSVWLRFDSSNSWTGFVS